MADGRRRRSHGLRTFVKDSPLFVSWKNSKAFANDSSQRALSVGSVRPSIRARNALRHARVAALVATTSLASLGAGRLCCPR